MLTYLMVQGVVLFNVVTYVPVKYINYEFPAWGHVIGIAMAMSSIGIIPAYIVYKIIITKGSMKQVTVERSL